MEAPVTDIFDNAVATDLSDDELERRVLGYAAQIAVLTGRFLDYLAEFDARAGWSGPGMGSCAQWLSWRAGMSLRTAQEHVRVARALTELPLTREHLAAGKLSYSKVRAISRVGTPEREPELVNYALVATASQLDRLVAAMPAIDRQPDPDLPRPNGPDTPPAPKPIESYGTWRWNEDGSLSLNVKLNPVDGAHVLAGLVRAEYERTRTTGSPDLPPIPTSPQDDGGDGEEEPGEATKRPRDLWRHVPTNIAPAVVMMADIGIDAVAIPEVAPGAEILVHQTPTPEAIAAITTDPAPADAVSAGTAADEVTAHLDDGPALTDAQHDELACDASVRTIGHDHPRYTTGPQLGPVVWWGRKRRTPNPALVRTVTMRDRCCQAPGCGRTRGLHIHHVTAWSKGGKTDPDNLILLCGRHHRALHDGDFVLIALGEQRFRFQTVAGSELKPAPPITTPAAWRPDVTVSHDSLTPEGNGPLDLGYVTEVLYAIWDQRERRRLAALAESTELAETTAAA